MRKSFRIFPVGIIKKQDESVRIEVYEEYRDALLGLDQCSHIIVFCWLHKNDHPEGRGVLQVHPKRNKQNPLTGVFATRSPMRPNLIALYICKILSIDGNTLYIEDVDAFDGSPIIDIKPYIPRLDSIPDAKAPNYR